MTIVTERRLLERANRAGSRKVNNGLSVPSQSQTSSCDKRLPLAAISLTSEDEL